MLYSFILSLTWFLIIMWKFFNTCLSYYSLPFVHTREGVHLDPIIYWVLLRIGKTSQQPCISKKNDQICFVSKWRQKRNSHFAKIATWPKFEKKNRIFQYNLAQSWRTLLQLHFWNKIWKNKNILFKNGGKTSFVTLWKKCPFMLISVKMVLSVPIFSPKDA